MGFHGTSLIITIKTGYVYRNVVFLMLIMTSLICQSTVSLYKFDISFLGGVMFVRLIHFSMDIYR